MAEEESDQEAERLGEELVAIVESPPGPVGLLAAGDGRGGAGGCGGGGCGGGGAGGVGISSRDYCRRFCQVRRPSAAPTCHRGSWASAWLLACWPQVSAACPGPILRPDGEGVWEAPVPSLHRSELGDGDGEWAWG